MLVSNEALFELNEILKNDTFEKYITGTVRRHFIALLLKEVEVVDVDIAIRKCRDPKDDKFLELAVSGKAENLLVVENIPMISCPRCGESYFTAETLHEIERIKLHRSSFATERPVDVAAFL